MADLIGKQLGQYKIISLLGKGGMANVYRARQESVERDVAIKVIKPELTEGNDFVDRFRREAKTVASLSHLHIVKVFDYGQVDEHVYLVTELLTGGTLTELIRRGALSTIDTARTLDQVASALDYAHRQGIIHRDLKPPNVLLDNDHNAFLTDFGIARLVHETTQLTRSGITMGTPAYMAPEQWNGQPVDARTDIYALGAMLFEMLTGHIPFEGDTPFRMMHMHIYEPPPSIQGKRPDLPPAVQKVLDKALAKNSGERFGAAGEMAAAFKAALANERSIVTVSDTLPPRPPTNTPPPVTRPVSPAAPKRNVAMWILAIPIVILVAVGALELLASGFLQGTSTTKTPTQLANSTTPSAVVLLPTGTSGSTIIVPPATAKPSATPSLARPTSTSSPTPTPTDTPNVQTLVAATLMQRTIIATLTISAYTKTPTMTHTATANLQASIEAGVNMTDTAVAVASFTKTPTLTPTSTPSGGGTGKIAYVSDHDGDEDIYVMDGDGTNPHNLTNNAAQDSEPAWSPDGTQIAFMSGRDGNKEIYLMDADGKNQRNLTNSVGDDEYPAWSPDGTQIAFMSDRDGNKEIYVMSADGKAPQRLTNNAALDYEPFWSSDGKHIVFVTNRDANYEIYVMDADGTNQHNLTSNQADDYEPVWSPDGKWILFMTNRDGNAEVYRMDTDGKNPLNLTNDKKDDLYPAWSPDMTQIAFTAYRYELVEIYVMDADGKNQHFLTNDSSNNRYPAWQPGARAISPPATGLPISATTAK